MLIIYTIKQFLELPPFEQAEIQKALRTKDRLEAWLRDQNKKSGQAVNPAKTAHWEECSRCKPYWEMAQGQRGYVWYEQYRNNNDVHPSQINKCLKFLWFSCNDFTDKFEEYIDPRLRMIFDLGHTWHNTIQKYGRGGAWGDPSHYHPEERIDPDAANQDGSPKNPIAHDYWIRGSVDAFLTDYRISTSVLGEVSIRLIHEYKTINSNGFSKLTRPKPEHKWQATMYSACLDAPIVVYIYTNKDDCKTADFVVPFDSGIWAEVGTKIRRVQELTELQREPDWAETSAVNNPRECMDCAARKFCQPPTR